MDIFQIWFGPLPEWRLDLMIQAHVIADDYCLYVPDAAEFRNHVGYDLNVRPIPRSALISLACDNWARIYAARGDKYAADIMRAELAASMPGYWYADTDIRFNVGGSGFDNLVEVAEGGPIYAPRSGGGGDIDLFYCDPSHHIGKVFNRLRSGGMPPGSVTPAVHVLSDPGVLQNEITLVPAGMFERVPHPKSEKG